MHGKKKSSNATEGMMDFRAEFTELKNELSQMVKNYLGPLLQMNKDISDQLDNVRERITKNENDIMECKSQLKELSSYTANSANTTAAYNSLLQVATEVRKQTSNQSKLYISNSESKKEVIDVLNRLMGKVLAIDDIIALSADGKLQKRIVPTS